MRGEWRAFEEGHTLGSRGSEGGIIVRDECHTEGARITLEEVHISEGKAAHVTTCGIYGWMLHTGGRAATRETADSIYDSMKGRLEDILALIPEAPAGSEDAPWGGYSSREEMLAAASPASTAISRFVDDF